MEAKITQQEPPIDRAVRYVFSHVMDLDKDPNNLQIVANATHGVATISNAIDAVAMWQAIDGINNLDTWRGIRKSAASFLADLIDGPIARVTGTSSIVGEAADAVGDKIKLIYALHKIEEMELAPKLLLDAVKLQNLTNVGITVIDQVSNHGNPQIHASWVGKRAILAQQTGIGLHVIAARLEKDGSSRAEAVRKAGDTIGWTGVGLGVIATKGYAETLWQSLQRRSDR